MTDSLRAGTYNLDGRAGSVTVYDNRGGVIGMLAGYNFQLTIGYNDKRMMYGDFAGMLANPLQGGLAAVQGSFVNL